MWVLALMKVKEMWVWALEEVRWPKAPLEEVMLV
jgi:hypothetical protein